MRAPSELLPVRCCDVFNVNGPLGKSRLQALVSTVVTLAAALAQVAVNIYFGAFAKEGYSNTLLSLIPLLIACYGVFALLRTSRSNIIAWLALTLCNLCCMVASVVVFLVAVVAVVSSRGRSGDLTPSHRNNAIGKDLDNALGTAEVTVAIVSFLAHISAFVSGLQTYVYLAAIRRAQDRYRQGLLPLAAPRNAPAVDTLRIPLRAPRQDFVDSAGHVIPFVAPARRDYPYAEDALELDAPILAYDCDGEPFAFAIPLPPGCLDPLLAPRRRRVAIRTYVSVESSEGSPRMVRAPSEESYSDDDRRV